jgi:hypothetical protein
MVLGCPWPLGGGDCGFVARRRAVFLHLVPPPPVEDAGVYSALIGKCFGGGALQPVQVSCNQQYSVMVTAVAASNDDCPTAKLRGVMAWSVPDRREQVVCLQRYVAEDPPSSALFRAGGRWPSSLVIPVRLIRPSSPLRLGLSDAPPTWSSPGSGYSVVCSDGSVSHSGGRQGACSYHGGIG